MKKISKALDAAKYFLQKDDDHRVSLRMLEALIFLTDWKYAIDSKDYKPFTEVDWEASFEGPRAKILEQLIRESLDFKIVSLHGIDSVSLATNKSFPCEAASLALDKVQSTREDEGDSFVIKLANSVYPMRWAAEGDRLNVSDSARSWVEHVRPKLTPKAA
ncbi:MAG: hypothetical protein WAX89_05710 [Alphaproteobacteria bacterium]